MSNPVAFVTGAAAGIGAAVAARLARSGHAVAVCDIDAPAVRAVAEHIAADGGRVLSIGLDVSDADAVTAAVARTSQELGVPTAVVTAAGIMRTGPFLSLSVADWERTLSVNLTGTFLVFQACARAMIDAGTPGALVALASVAARGPRPDAADYAASKAAIISLVESAAVALAPAGLRVNAICPGVVDTEMTRRNAAARAARDGISTEHAINALVTRVPLGRAAAPDEIAAIAHHLVSDEFGYVTGQALNVCGGLEFN